MCVIVYRYIYNDIYKYVKQTYTCVYYYPELVHLCSQVEDVNSYKIRELSGSLTRPEIKATEVSASTMK